MKHLILSLTVTCALLFGVFAVTAGVPSLAAPVPAITPVGGSFPAMGEFSNIVRISAVVTETGRTCRDTREWISADVAAAVTMAEANTTTLMLEHSNTGSHYQDGPALLSGVAASTNMLNRYDLFGVHTCLHWTVANTEPVTIGVQLLYRR